MAEKTQGRTLPQIALDEATPLDQLRRMLRQRADLQTLGLKYGPTRVYGPEDVKMLLAALVEWQARKAAKKLEAVA